MPWVIAIMMVLTVLATAAGLAVGGASRALSDSIAGKLTVQLPEANAAMRSGQVRAIVVELQGLSAVKSVRRLDNRELEALLDPWLGDVAGDEELPMPALIDVELKRSDAGTVAQISKIARDIAPKARVDSHANWLAPLADLMSALTWLALGLVGLMTLAMAAVVVLAVRAALNTHGETIAILHFLGSSDGQIASLFQRRIALDALFGCLGGFAVALLAMLLVGGRLGDIGSELLGSAAIPWSGWLVILALPIFGTLLAAAVARYTVTASLGKTL